MSTRFPSREAAAWYLAAMIDGEGSIGFSPRFRVGCNYWANISGTEDDIMSATAEALTLLEIPFSRVVRSRTKEGYRDCILLKIGGGQAGYRRLLELVPFQSARKRSELVAIIEHYCFAPKPRVARPPREWLEQEYAVKGRQVWELASECGVCQGTILAWLRKLQIPTRTHSESTILAFAQKRLRK